MSDFGMFEADEATQAAPRLAARTAGRKLEAAIDEVRAKFGRFLLGATGIDEFGDRWHLSKSDIRAAVEPHVFPNTGTMRRIQNAMKQDWKLAHPYKLAIDHDDAGFGQMPTGDGERNQDLDETYHPSSGNLIPGGDFEGWKDSVDQGGPEKVESHAFTPGGDSGSNRHAYSGSGKGPNKGKRPSFTRKDEGMGDEWYADQEAKKADTEESLRREKESSRIDREAASLVADIYTDFARSNGLRVASLDTLDAYASTGMIADADYRLLESMIVRTAEDCDDDDDEDGDEGGESEESDDSDDSEGGDAPDFGGSDSGGDGEADTDGDGDHDDADHHDGEGGEEEYDFSDENSDGEHDDADHHDDGEYDFGGGGGGDVGQTFTVPDEAPELDPRLQQEIPAGDTDGSAPIPPEVIDSLLGLPEGTIEQLLLEEVAQGGAPQGGGGDFLGGAGDDAEQEPSRTARRRLQARARNGDPRAYARLRADWERGRRRADRSARTFWAAEGDQEQPGGGDPSGGAQPPQGDPSQGGDPAAMGMDPAAMGGGQPMMPPPGSQAVAPPQQPQQLENQPAEDALLDTANQAIMQMIDKETAEYQQIIDPLSQALQAIQFAQQVEQAEHPMDVTPPEGTVDASPSAAPGGAQSMQQQAKRRRASKKVNALRNAARLIAGRYNLSHGGERMLLEAMGRRNYEHVREALQLLPPDHLQRPEHRAAVRHIGEMFAADNPRFNRDVWMRSVLGSAPGSRHPFDRPRLAGETLVHTPTMDHFEWENDQPRVDDNNPTTDLPKMKGAARAEDAVSRFQRWTKWRGQNGLVVPGGEGGIHTFMQKSRNPTKPKIGDEASAALHREMGFEPDAPKQAPKAKPVKAVNPTLRKPKAPKASRRTAAGFFLDGPRDEDEGRPDPSTLHCSRCGHTAPGSDDRADNLCPGCPGSVMDYRFYGHPTERLVREFKDNPESDYGDALFHELEHRSSIDDDPHAARAVEDEVSGYGPRGSRKAPPIDDYHARDGELSIDDVANAYRGWDPDDNPGPDDPRIKGASRTASFFTRRVQGWKWDDHLNGYISKEARAFTCACGERIAAPSYRTCACGKVWNVYAIGDTHHLASDTADMYVAREIEVRPGVVMANRRMAGVEDFGDWASQFSGENFFNRGRSNHDDYDTHPSDCGHNDQDLLDDGQSILCNDCGRVVGPMADQGRTGYEGWDPDADPGSDDPRIRGANRKLSAPDRWFEDEQEDLHRQRRQEEDDADAWAERRMDTPHRDDGAYREANRKMAFSDGSEHLRRREPGQHQIRSMDDGLVWNNDTGWGDDATVFSDDERDSLDLPMGGRWEPHKAIDSEDPYNLNRHYRSMGLSDTDIADLNQREAAKDGGCTCWEGYERVPGTEPCADGSCRKKTGAALFARLAAGGMSYEDAMSHIDEVLAEGEGHSLHHQPGVDVPHEHTFGNNSNHCEGCGIHLKDLPPPPEECPDCGGDGCDWDTYPNHEGDADLCRTCDGTGDAAVEFEPHLREPRPGSIRAEAAWQRHLAEIRRLADWTKYDDDVDPVVEAYGKPKPASTRIPKQPRDWAKRTPAGTWQGPAIPRKRK